MMTGIPVRTTMMVHFGKDRSQQWTLIRVDQEKKNCAPVGLADPFKPGAGRRMDAAAKQKEPSLEVGEGLASQ